jgi:hypothetical protein
VTAGVFNHTRSSRCHEHAVLVALQAQLLQVTGSVECLAPERELCAVDVPPLHPTIGMKPFLCRSSLSIRSTSRLENPISTKEPCGLDSVYEATLVVAHSVVSDAKQSRYAGSKPTE